MAKTITGTFKYPDNTPVANGVLKLRLSQAANISGTALFAPSEITINLDVNGSIPAATQIICNDELTPSGTTYYAAVYSANIVNGVTLISGQVLSQQWSITGTTPIDLTTLTPSSQGVSLVVPISSVSLTMPSEFSVSGSPVTASGGFTVTKATQAANLVFAGPTSGGNAQPAFRALVDADVAGVVNLRTNLAIPAGPDTIVGRSTTDTLNNKTLGGTTPFKRLRANGGTALASGNFAIGAGWGTGAALSAIAGTDMAFTVKVTAGSTSFGANPTLTLTFADGAFANAPIVVAAEVTGTAVATNLAVSSTTTTAVVTMVGTPSSGQVFIFNVIIMGI